MPSLVLPDRLIWFAHCPKAGGTSVERFMVARWGDAVGHLHWGWDLWWRRGGWRRADPPNSPQHLIWADALRHLPRPPDTVFALVRDPVARMASEYRWQRRGRRGTFWGKTLARLPFSLWLALMLEVARRHPSAYDNHFRPQGVFIPDSARVFRLEDGLDPVLAWLAETTGSAAPEAAPHVLANPRPTRIRPRDRARIAAAFAGDYARFGYGPPAEAPPPPAPLWLRALAPLVVRADRRGLL